MSDQRDPRFDAPRGRPRTPYGAPPPRPPQGHSPGRPPQPPPNTRVQPQRYRADGPPVRSGQPLQHSPGVPLLTHDDGDATEVVSGHGGVAVAERARQRSDARSDSRRGSRPTRKPASGWRRVRRILYVLLGLLLIGPFAAFVIGWVMFPLPSSTDAPLAQVATFKFADGEDLAVVRPQDVNRVSVTLDKVPVHVRNAVLSAEDRSFYTNPGFDLVGIARAVWNQLRGGVGGGSTVTQQYVKVSTGQDDNSLWRKYKEVIVAVKISREKSKDEILENYLNTIYFGRGAYGIEAAAKAYFDKPARELTVSEGAMLAGVIQAPSRWDPAKNLERSQERWAFVLDGMVEMGALPAADRATQVFPALPDVPEQTGGGVPGDDLFHIYERAVAELAEHGIEKEQLDTRGVTVTTTVRQPLQREAVDTVEEQKRRQPDNLRYALVSIDPKTGAILAYYGGHDGVGMDYASEAFRQPGSSFKPFVLSAALQNDPDFGLGTQLPGTGPKVFEGSPKAIRNTEGADCASCGAKLAMTESINTWFYELGLQVTPRRVIDAAHQAGIPEDLLTRPQGGIALGDNEVHPIDMASAYATFAAEGVYHEPYIVSKVQAADGEILYERKEDSGRQAVPQQVARNVIEAMLDVAPKKQYGLGERQVAAKTGTAQHPTSARDNRDAWFVGFTPGVSTAVWVGSDESDPIRDSRGNAIFGSGIPGKIWHGFMQTAVKGTRVEEFSPFEAMGEPPRPDVVVADDATSEDDEDGEGSEGSDRDEDGENDRGSSDDDRGSSSRNRDDDGGNEQGRGNRSNDEDYAG